MTVTLTPGQAAALSVGEGDLFLVDDGYCAPLADVQRVPPIVQTADGSTGDETLVVSLAGPGGPFPQGFRFEVNLGEGAGDRLVVVGSDLSDGFEFEDSGMVAPVTIFPSGVERFEVEAGAGDDTVDASGPDPDTGPFSLPLTIQGGPGDDTLIGGADDDVIEGGEGSDDLSGGEGFDALSYLAASGSVAVDLSAGTATGAGADVFSDFEEVVGSSFDDTLFGGPANDSLIGGPGDDFLDGGLGSDTLDGGDGTDTCLNGETLTACEDGSGASPPPPSPPARGPDPMLAELVVDRLASDRVQVTAIVLNQGDTPSRPGFLDVEFAGDPMGAIRWGAPLDPGEDVEVSDDFAVPDQWVGRSGEVSARIVAEGDVDPSNNFAEELVDLAEPGPSPASSTGTPWLGAVIVLTAALLIAASAGLIVRRVRGRRPPLTGEVHASLVPSEPEVHLVARPDGAPRHTVRLIPRGDPGVQRIRERSPR